MTMKELIGRPTTRRLIRSYGLLILLALAFLFLALFVREAPRTVPTQSVGATVMELM